MVNIPVHERDRGLLRLLATLPKPHPIRDIIDTMRAACVMGDIATVHELSVLLDKELDI